MERIVWLGGLVVGGGALYFAVLFGLGVRLQQFKVQSVVGAAASSPNA